MPRNVTVELNLQAVKEYLDGKGRSYLVAKKYGVNRTSIILYIFLCGRFFCNPKASYQNRTLKRIINSSDI